MDNDNRINAFRIRVENIPSLPTLPTTIIHINKILADPNSDAKQVGNVLEKDLALSSKVLKIANSSFYGMRTEITTLSRATVVLGYNTLMSIAITASILELFNVETLGGVYFTAEEFWKHSIGVACVSRMVCEEIRHKNPEEGWIAGLIHDIGKVILSQFFTSDFKEIISVVNEKGILIINAEKQVLGITHCNIGKWITEKWSLPLMLQEAIALHHSPDKARIDRSLTTVVHFADILCRMKGIGNGGDSKVPALDKVSFSELGLTTKMIKNITSRITEETDKAFSILELSKNRSD